MVSLSKGEKVSLAKAAPGLTHLKVGLGWDVNQFDGGSDYDLDASAFLTSAGGKVASDDDFVFYNNLVHSSGSVKSLGDNRTGEGEGDDEIIEVDLAKVPSSIQEINFTVTIFDAETRKQNFGQVNNAYIRVFNPDTNEELIRYDLGEDFSIETAIVVGKLYKNNGEWKFNAVGQGFAGGLAALGKHFGVNV